MTNFYPAILCAWAPVSHDPEDESDLQTRNTSCDSCAAQCSREADIEHNLLTLSSAPSGTGAEWYLVNTKGKREEQANSTHKERPCNAVTPKTLHIGNRKFHIFDNSTVPDKVSEGMLEYFKNSSRNGGSSEVPDPFLLYEIV